MTTPPHITALLDRVAAADNALVDFIVEHHGRPEFQCYLAGDQLPPNLEATRRRLRNHLDEAYKAGRTIACVHITADASVGAFWLPNIPGQLLCPECYLKPEVLPPVCCAHCLRPTDNDDVVTALIQEAACHQRSTDIVTPAILLIVRQCRNCAGENEGDD